MKLDATNYLEKPFTPDGLVTAVRLATDAAFVAELFYEGADALEPYELAAAEKLAILTADVPWIEAAVGKLGPVERRWLEQRLAPEVW